MCVCVCVCVLIEFWLKDKDNIFSTFYFSNWILVQVSIGQETVFSQALLAIHLTIFRINLNVNSQKKNKN